MVLIFVIVESPLEWRGIWDVCLGRHLIERVHVVVREETWRCIGSIWIASVLGETGGMKNIFEVMDGAAYMTLNARVLLRQA